MGEGSYCVVSFLHVWHRSCWGQGRPGRHHEWQCSPLGQLPLLSGLVQQTWCEVMGACGGRGVSEWCSTFTGGRGLLLCLISFAAGLVRFASGTSWSPAVPVCGSFSEGRCPVRFTGGSGCRSQTGVSGRVCHLTLGFVLCLLPLWACSADVLGGVRWFIAFFLSFLSVRLWL